MKRLLEVCAGSLQSVACAVQGGAERVELCSALALDGLTPSVGVMKTVRTMFPHLRVHVLIRPREGDFVYSRAELLAMQRDIEAALPYCDGIVTGALDREGHVDMAAMQCLVKTAGDRPVTFHRAFDQCSRPLEALEQIIDLGCCRLLTSGQAPTAEKGIDMLRRLSDLASGRLTIMPGGGINAGNALSIAEAVGTTEIHGSCSGGSGVTDADTVRRIIESLG